MDQSAQIESFKAALRMQESGSYEGNYVAQGKWNQNQADRSVGAYGIMSKNWAAYTQAAGIPNANWRDARAQDRVVSQAISNLANRWGGNWGLVAVSWYAGSGVAASIVEKHGAGASIDQIRKVAGDNVADYAQQVTDHGSSIAESVYGQENGHTNLVGDVGFLTAQRHSKKQQPNAAQDAIRARLVALAEQKDVTEPEVEVT